MNLNKIPFFSDGFKINGTIHLPMSEINAFVIGSHGFFSTGDSPKQVALANKCYDRGIAYFRFDHRGCGMSEGSFNDSASLDNRRADLINAFHAVKNFLPESIQKFALFGSSFGGAVCLSASSALNPNALVTYAAPISSTTLHDAFETYKESDDRLASINKEDIVFDLTDSLAGLSNILVIHGGSDDVVPIANAHTIYDNAMEPKKLSIQKNGDHPMSNSEHQVQFVDDVMSWLEKTL